MDVFPTLREVPYLGAPSGSFWLQIEVATRVIRPLQLDFSVLLQRAFLFFHQTYYKQNRGELRWKRRVCALRKRKLKGIR